MVQVKNQKLGAVGDVSADALHWKEVALPDRLDDAEGFFGLEEIEGVEVLRPQGAAKPPRFKVRPKFVGSGLS
jgi:ATP-dependent RNA helicase DDX24/MAK5